MDNEIVARDMVWPQPFKYLDFSNRGIELQVQRETSDQARVIINTRKPAKCLVFEEQDGIMLSDCAIDLVPGDEQAIIFSGLGLSIGVWVRSPGMYLNGVESRYQPPWDELSNQLSDTHLSLVAFPCFQRDELAIVCQLLSVVLSLKPIMRSVNDTPVV